MKAFKELFTVLYLIKSGNWESLLLHIRLPAFEEYYRLSNGPAKLTFQGIRPHIINEAFLNDPEEVLNSIEKLIDGSNDLLGNWKNHLEKYPPYPELTIPDIDPFSPQWDQFQDFDTYRNGVPANEAKLFLEHVSSELDQLKMQVPAQSIESPRIRIDISVAQLAYIFKALVDTKIFTPASNQALFKIISNTFLSKENNAISINSIEKHFYSPEDATKNYWNGKFIDLHNYAREDREGKKK